MSEAKRINRRKFLRTASTAVAAYTILPRHVLGGSGYVAPSEKINIGCIGVGAQGTRVMMNFLRQPDVQIVSVCDVNRDSSNYCEWGPNEVRGKVRQLIDNSRWGDGVKGCRAGREPAREIVEGYYTLQKPSGKYKGCTTYNDFREMLEKERDLDAVIVGTPDHTHAVISMKAMKMGKHVYCQKPFTHSIFEARELAKVSREAKIATQVATGNQASEETRLLCEWIWDGAIGAVREVHNWSSRPFWPQGINRPTETPRVPSGLDWDLWLGPAPSRPYHPAYLPFVWRGWYHFGSGALGDMGCYSFDTIFRVLKLVAPTSVEASSSQSYIIEDGIGSPVENTETFPRASVIHYNFPAREDMPPVAIHWYDGGIKPIKPAELDGEKDMPEEGLLFVGDKGKILCEFSGGEPRLIPQSKMDAYVQPPKILPRSIGHDEEWLRACKGGEPAGANFEFAGRVTETLLTGNVALRVGKKIQWDGPSLKATNLPEADDYIHRKYRKGWTL